MIGNICLLLGLSYLWFGVVQPLYRSTKLQQIRRSTEAIEAQKMLAVRSYYPGLKELSPRELRELYDVNGAYNQIGRY